MRCGHEGAVSQISWTYNGTDNAGDHYTFTRVFPFGEANATSTTKEIVFNREPVVVFEDDVQRVTIAPSIVDPENDVLEKPLVDETDPAAQALPNSGKKQVGNH